MQRPTARTEWGPLEECSQYVASRRIYTRIQSFTALGRQTEGHAPTHATHINVLLDLCQVAEAFMRLI